MFTLMAEYRGKTFKLKSGIHSEDEARMIMEEYQINYPDYDFFIRGHE